MNTKITPSLNTIILTAHVINKFSFCLTMPIQIREAIRNRTRLTPFSWPKTFYFCQVLTPCWCQNFAATNLICKDLMFVIPVSSLENLHLNGLLFNQDFPLPIFEECQIKIFNALNSNTSWLFKFAHYILSNPVNIRFLIRTTPNKSLLNFINFSPHFYKGFIYINEENGKTTHDRINESDSSSKR